MRAIVPVFRLLFAVSCLTQPLRAADVPVTLLVDPASLDLGAEETLTQLARQPARRLIVPCFVHGETLHGTQVSPFQQMPRYQGSADVLSPLIARMHLAGKQVYALVDCLHWTAPGAVPARDVLGKHPELAERTVQDDFGEATGGKYASPFHPRVRSALRELVEELAVRHPDLDGLVLRCRLSSNVLLGYSEAARIASIRARQIDPVDIVPGTGAAGKLHSDWVEWRIGQVAQLVAELSKVFRDRLPRARVAVLGMANLQRLSVASRNNLLEDWLRWAESGAIREVLLEHPWTEQGAGAIYASCQDKVAATRKPVELTVLLGSWPGKGPTPACNVPETLREQAVTGIAVPVFDREALPRSEPVPASQPPDPVPSPDVRLRLLRTDPLLQVGISGDWKTPSVHEVIALLSERTKVPLRLENEEIGSRTAVGSLSARNQPAWALMQQLAQSEAVQGHWDREGDGYVLRLEATSSVLPPSANRSRWLHLWLLGGGLLLPFALLLLVLWRRRARGTPPAPTAEQSAASPRTGMAGRA
jgi:hypothetical protein